ncbi:MAG TPA: PAS domain S-box protein, partial [Candidatus Acidoferrum sp.]|nr:PAS domain S-box protein [Candidatus Acidoferrum sp.]
DGLAAEVIVMTRLQELSTRLLASTELQDVLKEVLSATIALQNADFGNVQLYNSETLELEIVAHHGFQKDFLEYFGHVHEDSAACGRALQRRERVIIEDVETDPGFEPHRQIAASAGYRAVQSTPLFSRSGEPLGMISTHFRHPHRPSERELRLTDLYARQAAEMIDRQRVEEALRQSQHHRLRQFEQLETIYRTAPVGLGVVDAGLRILRVNSRLAEVIGLSLSACIGRRLREVMPGLADTLGPILTRVTQSRAPIFDLEIRGVLNAQSGGERIWRTSYFPVMGGNRKVTNVNFVVYDITERKRAEELLRQSEERFRMMVEGVKDYAIFMLDPEGRIVTWNAGAEHIKGYRADEIIGRHFSVFYTPEETQRGAPAHNLEVAAHEGRFVDEGWRLRKDGVPFWANVNIEAIRGEDGKLLGFSKVTRDLTERKRIEQELENERDRLRLLLELTNQVVSSLDLRGVFRAVSTSLRRFARADAAMLLLPDPERNRLRLFALDLPESRGFLREGMHIPVEGSYLGQVFRTGEPRVIEGPDLPPDAAEILKAAAEEGFTSSCALPLINKDSVIGVLILSRKAAVPFIGGEVEFLLRGAAQVAIAVANAQDYRQVIEAKERLVEERLYLQDEIRTEYSADDIVGESAALKGVLQQVEHVAP